MIPLKVTFHLDGTGCVLYPGEPTHLDGLLAWAKRMRDGLDMDCDPDAPPEETDLPLERRQFAGEWIWAASALIPEDGAVESVQFARRRTDVHRIELQNTPIVRLDCGITKITNRPWPLLIQGDMHAYCVGELAEVRALAELVPAIGKERARGKGRVVRVSVEPVAEDYSCVRDGLAMRYIPHPDGARLVRPRAPYWHMSGRCMCLSPGEEIAQ